MTRRSVLLAVSGLAITAMVFAVVKHRMTAATVPSFAAVRAAYHPSDTRLLDRHGEVLHELRVDVSRRRLEWTPLAEISPALQRAVLTSEDRRFFRHHGVDLWALVSAAGRHLTGGRLRGASTITMQLSALLDPAARRHTAPRTLAQKWRQMRGAWAIERRWSKAEIREAYLNLVTFRGELQGVAAATSVLFGKAPHGITEPEALVLAVLVQSPNAEHATVLRRATSLETAQNGSATHEDILAAVTQALNAPPGSGPRVALAPHVAHALLHSSTDTPARSTLDAATQRHATDALERTLTAVRARHVEDGAVLVLDNASGAVLAYVGSSGALSSAPQVDGVRARRQAGSALKPFLYALAFDQRLLTPASLLEDTPLEVPVAGGLYRPQDYDEQFRGLVSARTALSASLNVPAVRVLQLVGEEAFVQQLRRMGFVGLIESGDYYGPALALGGAEVTLWELTNAYRALANGGVWSPLRLTEETAEGGGEQRVYSEAATFLVASVLADRESRSVTFGLDNPLGTRFWSAVKTGTSKEMRDNWCVGFSQRYTVGVWVGNFSGAPMRNVSGITGAAPIWLEIMNWLHRDSSSLPPDAPAGVQSSDVTFSRAVEAPRPEWFLTGTEPLAAGTMLATHRASIVTPVSGTRIALDPDIPAAQQRVVFQAHTDQVDARFAIDGLVVGAARQPFLWEPRPGTHSLALIDGEDRHLDRVTFTVRGVLPNSGR